MATPDEERADKAVKVIIGKYEAPRKAFDEADRQMCEARVEIGKYLFAEFFGDDTNRINKGKFEPLFQSSYALLKSKKSMPLPLKSKTGLRNLVMLGYQSVWLKEHNIDLEKLIEDGKIGYTHLVRLDSMPYDEKKVKLLQDIALSDTAFSVSELEEEIRNRLKKTGKVPGAFPADFDKVMSTGWMPEVVGENIKLVTEGMEVDEEKIKNVLNKLLKDIKAAAEHGYDQKTGGILEARGIQIEKTLRDAARKARDYLEYINTALRKLDEKKPKKEKKEKIAV